MTTPSNLATTTPSTAVPAATDVNSPRWNTDVNSPRWNNTFWKQLAVAEHARLFYPTNYNANNMHTTATARARRRQLTTLLTIMDMGCFSHTFFLQLAELLSFDTDPLTRVISPFALMSTNKHNFTNSTLTLHVFPAIVHNTILVRKLFTAMTSTPRSQWPLRLDTSKICTLVLGAKTYEHRCDATSVSDNWLKCIGAAGKCSSMVTLNLGCCRQITDTGVEMLAKGCPQLKSLDLWYCEQITDKSMVAVAVNCNLTCLNLRSCSNISDTTVEVSLKLKRIVLLSFPVHLYIVLNFSVNY